MTEPAPQTLDQIGEFGLIARIAQQTATSPAVALGIGDDAALLSVSHGHVVACVDLLVEGRHFRQDWSTAIEVGRRAAAASMADVAAMGATTTALLVGLAAPQDLRTTWVLECAAGLAAEAKTVGAVLVGGDLTAAPTIMISVTALGDLGEQSAVLRSGARPGDRFAIAGRVGWAAAGLAVLSRGFRSPRILVDAHRVPEPPYQAGPQAAKAGATAMIDVSDGLIADARHVAEASGVCIDIHADRLPIPEELASAAAAYTMDPLEWMLTGGDDHALLATFPAGTKPPRAFRLIGEVKAPDDNGPGVLLNGSRISAQGGHEHFRGE
jgi:thiamine-monophosphate kinase